MSSLYIPGGSVLGILSSVSLGVAAGAAGGPVVVGPVVVGRLLLWMALCVATSDALSASKWSPSMGPIFWAPNLTSVLNLSHHATRSAGSGLNSTKAVSDVRPMWTR